MTIDLATEHGRAVLLALLVLAGLLVLWIVRKRRTSGSLKGIESDI
jgi:hypothetical protein